MKAKRMIRIWQDPFGTGLQLTKRNLIEFKPGVTVLVGCNGSGKTTLLRNIKDELEKGEIPFIWYDNLTLGGDHANNKFGFYGMLDKVATRLISSEGEKIYDNLGENCATWKDFLTKDVEKHNNERWILLDAIDSGLSINNIMEVKDVLRLVSDDAVSLGIDLYIIITANSYEMTIGQACLDVNSGEYRIFPDYDDYKEFIMSTKREKDKR